MNTCPECKEKLEFIGVQTLEFVFRRMELEDGSPSYWDADSEPISKGDTVYYCPYCNEELPIKTEAEAIEFLKG